MATFVFVHGSYQGGWIWQPVAYRLRAAGHRIYAPRLDGCGERKGTVRPGITTETQADEVAQLLFYEDLKDVVLVGTSWGDGRVLGRRVDSRSGRPPGVGRRLVIVQRRKDPRHRHPLNLGNGRACHRTLGEEAANRLFADLDPASRAWALERYAPHPIGIYDEPVELDSFWTQSWRASVIWCRRAPNPGEAHQRRAAERLKATWAELDTGHYPMLSMPEALSKMLVAG